MAGPPHLIRAAGSDRSSTTLIQDGRSSDKSKGIAASIHRQARVRPMREESNEVVPEAPATWENVVVGEAKKVVGHAIRDDELIDEGDEQEKIAHDVREEYREEQSDK
jgi:uncharacterized protein YjbJ (UPF0337 family)